jgi:hypothetical protein
MIFVKSNEMNKNQLAVSKMKRFYQRKLTHILGEETETNIKRQDASNILSYNSNLVLHLLTAGAEERQETIISNMNLLHYSSGCTKL